MVFYLVQWLPENYGIGRRHFTNNYRVSKKVWLAASSAKLYFFVQLSCMIFFNIFWDFLFLVLQCPQKIRLELKIVNFLLTILQIVCDSVIQSLLNFRIFAFLNFWFWEKKKVCWFFFGHRSSKKIKTSKKHHTEELHKKRYNFASGATNHTFLLTLYFLLVG